MFDFKVAAALFGPQYNDDFSLPDGEDDEFDEQDSDLVLVDQGAYGSGNTWKYRGIEYVEDDGVCTANIKGTLHRFNSSKAANDYIKSITPNYTNRAFELRAEKAAKLAGSKLVVPGQDINLMDPCMKYKGHIIGYCRKDGKFYADIDARKGYDRLSEAAKAIEDASIKWK